MTKRMVSFAVGIVVLAAASAAFQSQPTFPPAASSSSSVVALFDTPSEQSSAAESPDLVAVKQFLEETYPSAYSLLRRNDAIWKQLGGSEQGFTVFAANEPAFRKLGNRKLEQLADPRNAEGVEKIAAYHVVAEVVAAEQIFQAGGILTLGGEIPVDRTVSGGIFGIGGKEDGGVTVNGAKLVQSTAVGNGIVHEVDDLVSPNLLWRYMDQLRIPGSR